MKQMLTLKEYSSIILTPTITVDNTLRTLEHGQPHWSVSCLFFLTSRMLALPWNLHSQAH